MADPAGRLTSGGVARDPSDRRVIFLSVGEPSGDLHGAALAKALRSRIPGVRLIGLGGPQMAREGVELLADVDDLAVMGFVEVLSRLPFFLRLRRTVFDALRTERVDLVIPVDYPGFNLRLARHARAEGRRVLYYIAPQVWAWHASRASQLAADTDRIAVILPFEVDFLREHGASAEFVGHPLLDLPAPESDRNGWRSGAGLDPAKPLLALMPGSRRQELKRHLSLFTSAAAAVRAARPDVQVMIGAPDGMPEDAYASASYPVTRDAHGLLRNATAALVKSGTTTLETALAGTPFVVAYRMNPVTFQIAKRVVEVPHIALANLVAGRRVVEEFVQGDATPEALCGSLLRLLSEDRRERDEVIEGLIAVREALGRGGAAEQVAEMAADLLDMP